MSTKLQQLFARGQWKDLDLTEWMHEERRWLFNTISKNKSSLILSKKLNPHGHALWKRLKKEFDS